MADYQTIRPSGQTAGVGARSADIDAGLRAHMNKVYGLMSVAMLITFAAAWAVGTSESMINAIFGTPLRFGERVRWLKSSATTSKRLSARTPDAGRRKASENTTGRWGRRRGCGAGSTSR